MGQVKVKVEFIGSEEDAEELLDLLRFIAEEVKVKRKANYEEEENDDDLD